jgi:hypothetical protein
MGLLCDPCPTFRNGRLDGRQVSDLHAKRADRRPSQKIQKTSKSLLTPRGLPAYIRLTNDGGDAAGDEEVRF